MEWYAAEGAHIEQGAPLYSVETDKATVDVESPAGGVLLRIDAEADRDYPVGATLAWIGESGEELPDRTDETAAAPAAVPEDRRVTPVARRLAERRGVDADRLEGTGPGGRVTKEDVQRAIDSGAAPLLEAKPPGEPAHDVLPLEGIPPRHGRAFERALGRRAASDRGPRYRHDRHARLPQRPAERMARGLRHRAGAQRHCAQGRSRGAGGEPGAQRGLCGRRGPSLTGRSISAWR